MTFWEEFYPPAPELLFHTRLLAYVDILGWTALINSRRHTEVAERIFSAMVHLRRAREAEVERKRNFAAFGIPFGQSVRMAYFSDTFVYSCAPTPDEAAFLVSEVQSVCARLLRRGHYARGAVVVGELQHNDDGLVGRALVAAHEIERNVAKYPRLVVTGEAAPLLLGPRLRVEHDPGPSQVRTDFDGLQYLDIFRKPRTARVREDIVEAKAIVEKDLNATNDLNHRAKYQWLLRYLDDLLAEPPPAADSSPAK